MSLKEEIEERRREIKTDGYSMSIGEIVSMYRDGDIDIHPEFQRIYRWTDEQKSRLVESILLGIPVPTIFVSQREDGVWDVIDGVQRLCTILEFVGIYRDEDDRQMPPLRLMQTEYLPSLEGHAYGQEDTDNEQPCFDDVLRRDFKRSPLSFVIIKKESDRQAKFDLFQRLNSGTQLSAQEARNCLMVMLDDTFYRWIKELSLEESFQQTVVLSDRKEDEGFREELVIRFFANQGFAGPPTELKRELGDFVTEWVRNEGVAPGFDRDAMATLFRRVFACLNSELGEDTFKRWDKSKRRFMGAFSISAFEAVTSGVGAHLDFWTKIDPDILTKRVKQMWSDEEYRNSSRSGISPKQRMPRLVNFGREFFQPGP